MRWFGENDPVGLDELRQVPGLDGIVSSLFNIPSDQVIPPDQLRNLKKTIHAYGFSFEVLESIPVHENIKLGLPDRDRYIEIWIKSMGNAALAGIPVICYNFMLAFDWVRTNLRDALPDGSFSMSYDHTLLDRFDFSAKRIAWANTYTEDSLKAMLEASRAISAEKLWSNLEYFLGRVLPEAERLGIRLAMHPDDPPWEVFGIKRIMGNREGIERLLNISASKSNGLSICTGSLGVNPQNNIPEILTSFAHRLYFMHIRNVKITGEKKYHEVSHKSSEGSLDIYEIMRALYEASYSGPVRPDHGRDLWGEQGITGYGLFDRALGLSYLQGIQETLEKSLPSVIARSISDPLKIDYTKECLTR